MATNKEMAIAKLKELQTLIEASNDEAAEISISQQALDLFNLLDDFYTAKVEKDHQEMMEKD